jgi:hypothetical protein
MRTGLMAAIILTAGLASARGQAVSPPTIQNTADLGTSSPKGISALYRPTGEAIQVIFGTNSRWQALPRTVRQVQAQPDQDPTFAMWRDDSYSQTSDEARWSAEQSWPGFRLLYAGGIIAENSGDLWIGTYAGSRWLRTHGRWVTIKPDPNITLAPPGGTSNLARDAAGDWWMTTPRGLYRLEYGQWVLRNPEGWDGIGLAGIAAGPEGQLVVWSNTAGSTAYPGFGTVALSVGGKWSAAHVLCHGGWSAAAFRPDGSVILAGRSQVVVLPAKLPPAATADSVFNMARQLLDEKDRDKRLNLLASLLQCPQTAGTASSTTAVSGAVAQSSRALARLDEFVRCVREGDSASRDAAWQAYLGQKSELDAVLANLESFEATQLLLQDLSHGRWFGEPGPPVELAGPMATSADGTMVFCVRTGPNGPWEVAALGADNHFRRLQGLPAGALAQVLPYPDGRFLLRVRDHEDDRLLLWQPGQGEPRLLDRVSSEAGLLGADRHGRLYFRRDDSLMVFTPAAEVATPAETRILASVPSLDPTVAVVADDGRLWFCDRDGSLFLWESTAASGPEKYKAQSLPPVKEVFAGRGGAILARCIGDRVALCWPDKAIVATCLADLAREHFDELMAAAPTSTRDPRRHLTATWKPVPSPWLAVGNHVWLRDARSAYCAGPAGKCLNVTDLARALGYGESPVTLMGPLQSGQLILAPDGRRMEDWIVVDLPGAEFVLSALGRRPHTQGGAPVTDAGAFSGQWLLDSQGRLWLHQAFDRVYCVGDIAAWPMIMDFGQPWLEHGNGQVWALRSIRAYPGYQVGTGGAKPTPCPVSFLHRLTPLQSVAKDRLLCLSPLGLAVLAGDPANPDSLELASPTPVAWRGTPFGYCGRTSGWTFFVTSTRDGHSLQAVAAKKGKP